ncbi:hypothetical protein [Halomicrococcus sp. SG-WS-1]|uniref:hypothetical protein n=1 Tax=Halomicrococcus sp. SG-WS-1 TaxID=3439057 RepID=UPI003F7998F2
MDIESLGTPKLVAIGIGAVVGLVVVDLVLLPVALLALSMVGAIVEEVVRVVTEPRTARRSR